MAFPLLNKRNQKTNRIHPLPPSTINNQSSLSSLKESIVSGVGAGVGFNLADRLVSSLFGARKVQVEHVASESSPSPQEGPSVIPLVTCDTYRDMYNKNKFMIYDLNHSQLQEFRKC